MDSSNNIENGKPEMARHEDDEFIVIDEPIEVKALGNKVSNTFQKDPSTKKRKSSTDSLNGKFREEVGS